jgi:hypothetical protein
MREGFFILVADFVGLLLNGLFGSFAIFDSLPPLPGDLTFLALSFNSAFSSDCLSCSIFHCFKEL